MGLTSTTINNLNNQFAKYGIYDWQECAERYNIPLKIIYNRIVHGMNPFYACTTPVRQRKKQVVNKIFRRWNVRNHKITIVEEPVSFIWEEPVFDFGNYI